MKTKISTEKDREILSSVKKEMARPRLAASVRDDYEAEAAPRANVLAIHPTKA
ncbi:MAG TPA: hypothetical protein VKF63_10595 [Terracidiphilus sp.]|nr:hypothetical protein [Terracidiphilus sp.]